MSRTREGTQTTYGGASPPKELKTKKIIRAKKTLNLLKNGKIPVEFRDENKKKDFKFLPDIAVIIEFLCGIGIEAEEFSHPGLRTAWGEAMVSTRDIDDLFERIQEHDKGIDVTKVTLDGKKIQRKAYIKDLHYVKTRLKPCTRKFKIHNVLGKVTKDEIKEFLKKLGTEVEVDNDMVKPTPDHPKAEMIMQYFNKMKEENRGLTDSYVCKIFSKEPMPANIPVGGKLLTLSGPGINPQCNWCFQTCHFERYCTRKLNGFPKLPIEEYEKQLIDDFNAPEESDIQEEIEQTEAIIDGRPINANKSDTDLEIETLQEGETPLSSAESCEDYPPPGSCI